MGKNNNNPWTCDVDSHPFITHWLCLLDSYTTIHQ